jgi:hypothetical protein
MNESQTGWSFLIITNGKRPNKILIEIDSIKRLKIPQFEIIVCGISPGNLPSDVKMIDAHYEANNAEVTKMRNILSANARFDKLVFLDDDIIFHDDFYEGLVKFGDDWDVLGVRILNLEGTRFWDWSTIGGPRGHRIIDYDDDDEFSYLSGGIVLVKSSVAKKVKWNESLKAGQADDVDFSFRVKRAGFRIGINPHSTTTHNDGRYFQAKNSEGHPITLRRKEELGVPVKWVAPFKEENNVSRESLAFVETFKDKLMLGICDSSGEKFSPLDDLQDNFKKIKSGFFVCAADDLNKIISPPAGFYSICRLYLNDKMHPNMLSPLKEYHEVWVCSNEDIEILSKSGFNKKVVIFSKDIYKEDMLKISETIIFHLQQIEKNHKAPIK